MCAKIVSHQNNWGVKDKANSMFGAHLQSNADQRLLPSNEVDLRAPGS